MSEVRLSFKEMCEKFDVTPRTLRYYEYIELLSPEKDGRARFYGPREVARMTLNWWRGELAALYTGAPTHPVTRALLAEIAARG